MLLAVFLGSKMSLESDILQRVWIVALILTGSQVLYQ
jgi:hypothetical protein